MWSVQVTLPAADEYSMSRECCAQKTHCMLIITGIVHVRRLFAPLSNIDECCQQRRKGLIVIIIHCTKMQLVSVVVPQMKRQEVEYASGGRMKTRSKARSTDS